ncbi:MAG TPA: PQQ-binding-like beta-propeller repeat protein [Planctomycetota bacterium]|jgi:hypothetical protein
MRLKLLTLSLLIALAVHAGEPAWDDLPEVKPASKDWPWWRGPTRNDIAASAKDPPVKWSPTENIAWKAEVPGRGHGTPCIWGDKIFLPTADDKAQVQYLLCFDRKTGEKLWQTEVHKGGFMKMHPKNSHASSTPACDGERVFIPFMVQNGMWLTALDFSGKILWQKKLGAFVSMHGYGSSPVIYRSAVIVLADNVKGSYVTAVHRKTGEILWRTERPDYYLGNYSSPNVGTLAGREQLVIPGPNKVISYEPLTGKVLWSCDGPSESATCSVTYGGDLVYCNAGYPKRNLLCIRGDGSGDVTKTHIVWRKDGGNGDVPALLLSDGLLYQQVDEGRIVSFDAAKGDIVWENKLKGVFSSSPVLADGKIYISNEAGNMYVLKAGRAFEVLAENNMAEGCYATPVILGNRIFLRTFKSLWCVGK